MRKCLARAGLAALLTVTTVTACGADDGSAGSAGPITVYQIAPIESQITSLPDMGESAKAAVAEVNDAGGVNGRDIELIVCNDKFDPNEALRCAQKAAQDESAVAVVGMLTGFGQVVLPVLEQAGLAAIGTDVLTETDAQSPANFLFDPGVATYGAMVAYAQDLGWSKPAVVLQDNSNAEPSRAFLDAGAEATGMTLGETILVPTDAVDYAVYVAQVEKSGADGIIMSLTPEATLRFWGAIDAAGSSLKVITGAGNVTEDAIEQAGAVTDGDVLIGGVPPTDPSDETGEAFLEAMDKYAEPGTAPTSPGLRAWAAVHLFTDVAKTIDGDITRESVLDAFNKVHDRKFMWIDSLSFDQEGPIPELPRVTSALAFPAEIKDGKQVWGEPFDPFPSS